jgi:hypothetical protein
MRKCNLVAMDPDEHLRHHSPSESEGR